MMYNGLGFFLLHYKSAFYSRVLAKRYCGDAVYHILFLYFHVKIVDFDWMRDI